MKKYLLFFITIVLTSLYGHAQDFAHYKQNLDWQVYNYPQEKIHVTTDKPEFYAPRYDTGNNGIGEGADLRETLYWNPSIAINNKQAHFNFYTNDAASTSYTITVEGVTANGELIHATKKITKK